MSEQNFEPIEDADLDAVSGGADDQGDQANWYHKKCPKCGSSNIKVSTRIIGIPTRQMCLDCLYQWDIIGSDEGVGI